MLKPAWIDNYGRKFSEWATVFLYLPKSQVKISIYIFHSISDDGIYLVSKHVFLWAYVRIFRVINYYWWPIRVKSNLFWVLHSWIEYVAYHILWNCAENKGSVFGVDFGRLLSFLSTEITWTYILSPGCAFLSWKVSCLHPYPIELDL